MSWVRSFGPIENPANFWAKSSARMTLLGTTHMKQTSRPFSSRLNPFLARSSMNPLAFVDRTIAGTGDFARCAVDRNTHFGRQGLKAP